MQNRCFWNIQAPRLHSSLANFDENVVSVFFPLVFYASAEWLDSSKRCLFDPKTLVCDFKIPLIEASEPPIGRPGST